MKNKKKYLALISLLPILLLLTSCAQKATSNGVKHPPTDFFYGTIYKIFGIPMQNSIIFVGNALGGKDGYGYAILLITIIVRLILLPLMLNQSKKMTVQQEKIRLIQPQLNIINNQIKQTTDQNEKVKLNQLLMDVYKKNDTSLIPSMGCLTLIIQLPFFSGLYLGIEYSQKLSESFLWGINLGKSNIYIAIIAALSYVIQGYISMINLSEEQKKQTKTALIISPLMILFISIGAPAGLGLYFLGTGILVVIQQIITTFILQPRIKAKMDEDLKEKPIVVVVDETTFVTTDKENEVLEPDKKPIEELRKKNSGKQNINKPE